MGERQTGCCGEGELPHVASQEWAVGDGVLAAPSSELSGEIGTGSLGCSSESVR